MLETGAEPLRPSAGVHERPPAEAGQDTLTVGLRDRQRVAHPGGVRRGARASIRSGGWASSQARRHRSRWALLFNGTHARLLDAVRLFQRRHLEFDLDLAVDVPHTGAALWATLHRDALEERPAGTPSFLARAIELSDAHAGEVCASLRTGVLAASADVLNTLMVRAGHPDVHDAFEQSLTVVYRMLFLLFAEAREPGAGVAPDLPGELQHRGPAQRRPRQGRQPGALGRGARCQPPGARRLPGGRSQGHRRSTDGCSTLAAPRSWSGATWTTKPRCGWCSR